MKKIYIVFVFTLIVSIIVNIIPKGLDGMLFGLVSAIFILFLLPFIGGILLVLVQKKNRSYQYLPALLFGTLLNNITVVLVAYIIMGIIDNHLYRPTILIHTLPGIFLPFFALSLFGGLIGLVIRGTSEQFKKYPNSKIIIVFRKIFGSVFLVISTVGALISIVIFLILLFYPSSSLLNIVMVDFKLIEVIGVIGYYLLLLSALFILLIPIAFFATLGLTLFQGKSFFKLKLSLGGLLVFLLWFAIFTLLSFHVESRFTEKKVETKSNHSTRHFYIKDFDNINVSKYVEFDEITIKQGKQFSIVAKGSEYDQIGLDFEKINSNTLLIKRSELETYYNTDTWTVENRGNILFPAGTKHLAIEITMPDIEKIILNGGHAELVDFDVDDIEIKLNKRFNNIKGNIKVEDTLKLDAYGGIINLVGSAKNLIINSGDCWIEMDKFMAENATINAINTSRLNVNVSNNMDVQSGENSGIVNHYDEL